MLVDHLLNIVKELKNLRETGNLKNLYKNELDQACFAHDVSCSDSKDLAKRTISYKILKDRVAEIARTRGNEGHQTTLVSMVYKLFDRKWGSGVSVNEQLHKPVIKRNSKEETFMQNLKTVFG